MDSLVGLVLVIVIIVALGVTDGDMIMEDESIMVEEDVVVSIGDTKEVRKRGGREGGEGGKGGREGRREGGREGGRERRREGKVRVQNTVHAYQ